MSLDDKASPAQISAVRRLVGYKVSPRTMRMAAEFLENKTKRDVSKELGRIRDLYIERKLSKDNAFTGEIWKGFDYNDSESPSHEQTALIYSLLNKCTSCIEAVRASSWIGLNTTRDKVSAEIDRLKALDARNALDKEECFRSVIWEGFEAK